VDQIVLLDDRLELVPLLVDLLLQLGRRRLGVAVRTGTDEHGHGDNQCDGHSTR